jgi:hypothetical protein
MNVQPYYKAVKLLGSMLFGVTLLALFLLSLGHPALAAPLTTAVPSPIVTNTIWSPANNLTPSPDWWRCRPN